MAKVWGHRGASGYAPENTMEAFALAVEMGAYGIELDVQMSADGKLVVCHDERIDRTSNGSGAIAALSYEKLAQYNYHAGFSAETFYRLPLLEEVLELLKPTALHLNIELKCDSLVRYEGMEVKAVQAVRQAGMEERVLLTITVCGGSNMSIPLQRQEFSMKPVCISPGYMPKHCRPRHCIRTMPPCLNR